MGSSPDVWFIEENQFRVVDQGLSQPDTLQHALGEILETLVAMRGEPYEVDEGGNAVAQTAGRHSRQAPVQFEEFGGSKPFVEAEIFREETDFAAHRHVVRGSAEDIGLAAGRLHQAQQNLNGGAFPGTVWSQETKYFAAPHVERQISYGHLAAENLA